MSETCIHEQPIIADCAECKRDVLAYNQHDIDAAYKMGMMRGAEMCWQKGFSKAEMLQHEHGYMYAQGYDAATEHCYHSIKEEAEKP